MRRIGAKNFSRVPINRLLKVLLVHYVVPHEHAQGRGNREQPFELILGQLIEDEKRAVDVVKDLPRQPLAQQPGDFQELRRLISERAAQS